MRGRTHSSGSSRRYQSLHSPRLACWPTPPPRVSGAAHAAGCRARARWTSWHTLQSRTRQLPVVQTRRCEAVPAGPTRGAAKRADQPHGAAVRARPTCAAGCSDERRYPHPRIRTNPRRLPACARPRAWSGRRFRANRAAMVALVFIVMLAGLAIVAPAGRRPRRPRSQRSVPDDDARLLRPARRVRTRASGSAPTAPGATCSCA